MEVLKMNENENTVATAVYRVAGVSEVTHEPLDTYVTFKLLKSGAFEYGNGLSMTMQFKDSHVFYYDLRYERVNIDSFNDFTAGFLDGYLANGLEYELQEV